MKRIALLIASVIAIAASSASAQDPKRCKGIKADGTACRSIIKEGSYCQYHNPDALHCGAKTRKGTPCKIRVKKQGDRCRYHQ